MERQDGQPLTANDQQALAALLAGYEIEHGREVSDQEAASIAALAPAGPRAAAPLAATGTGGE